MHTTHGTQRINPTDFVDPDILSTASVILYVRKYVCYHKQISFPSASVLADYY